MWNREKYCSRLEEIVKQEKFLNQRVKSKEGLYQILGEALFVSPHTVKSWTRKNSNGPGDLKLLNELEKLLDDSFCSMEQITERKENYYGTVFKKTIKGGKRKILPGTLLEMVAKYYAVSVSEIISDARDMRLRKIREVCIFLMRHGLDLSLKEISTLLNREIVTVLALLYHAEEGMEKGNNVAKDINRLKGWMCIYTAQWLSDDYMKNMFGEGR